ncbi:MAG: MarR family transcriptional regulator [Flavobacteriales bacterium]|nr:MarR family transcriptional regulator [Flavobacteriales bacterium]
MITNTAVDKNLPLGHYLAVLSKSYVGALIKRLEDSPVDRYYMVIQVLHQAKTPFTQQSLGDFLNVDKVTMVRILDHLSEKGFINRVNNPNDRREKLLELTDAGTKAVKEIDAATKELNCKATKDFTDEEKALFYQLIEKMNDNLCDIPVKKIYLNFKRSKK